MTLKDKILFLLVVLIWGTTYVAIKYGLEFFPPILYAALSYEAAGLVLLPVMLVRSDKVAPESREDWIKILVGAVLMVGTYQALLFLGQTRTVSFVAAVVIGLSPINTACLSVLLLPGTTITFREVSGLVVSLFGVIIITNRGGDHLLPPQGIGEKFLGPLMYFVGILMFDLGLVLIKRIKTTLPAMTFQVWSMLLGGGLLHVLSITAFGEQFSEIVWNWYSISTFAYFVLLPTTVAYVLYYSLLEHIGPIRVNLVSYFTPVVAVFAGWMTLGEVPTFQTIVGFVIIFSGIFLFLGYKFPRFRRSRKQEPDSI